MKLRQNILLFFFIMAIGLRAQDIHFSQFNGSLLNLNPGFTGFFNGDYRAGAIFRSQWQSVPVSYSTFSMHGETRMRPRQLVKDMVGVGLLFNSDRAGDARYGSNQFYLNGNYIFLARPDSSLMITMGMNIGFCQVSFDYTKMTFDSQYDGTQYNRSLGSGENFNFVRGSFADVNLGSVIQYIHNSKHRFIYGISVHHITSPVISYQGNDLSRLDYKLSNFAGYTTAIKRNTDLITEALFSIQGKNIELIPHASLKYHINRKEAKAISGGACFRARDAVVLRLGYYYQTLQSGISYDINVSRFTAATARRGGFEIFVNYVFKVRPGFVAKKRACPVFM